MRVSRIAFLVHSYIGVKFILIVLLVLGSGTLSVFHEELDWLSYSQQRLSPEGNVQDLDYLYRLVAERYPQAQILSIRPEEAKKYTASSMLLQNASGSFRVNINQYTGEILGSIPIQTVGQFIYKFHYQLYMPFGREVVNVTSLLIAISFISGLLAYKRFWKKFLKWPRTNAGSRVFWGDLHRLVALWSIWFILVITASGCWWFYHQTFAEYTGAPLLYENVSNPSRAIEIPPQLIGEEEPGLVELPLVVIVQNARNYYPDLIIENISLPNNEEVLIRITGNQGGFLTRRTTRLDLNPYSGEVINARGVKDYNNMQRINEAMYPLHFGTWGKQGLPRLLVKCLWFVFGLLLTFIAYSGLTIALRRIKKQSREPRAVTQLMSLLGGYKYLNVVFLILICLGTTITILINL